MEPRKAGSFTAALRQATKRSKTAGGLRLTDSRERVFTMANGRVAKDLFGNPVRQWRPRYDTALERGEKKTLPERAAQVRWLSGVIPRDRMFMMPVETSLV